MKFFSVRNVNYFHIILGRIERNDVQCIESDEPPKIPYPKRVFLILGTEFCERFTYLGMSSKLIF